MKSKKEASHLRLNCLLQYIALRLLKDQKWMCNAAICSFDKCLGGQGSLRWLCIYIIYCIARSKVGPCTKVGLRIYQSIPETERSVTKT